MDGIAASDQEGDRRLDLQAAALLAMQRGTGRSARSRPDHGDLVSSVYQTRLTGLVSPAELDIFQRSAELREEGLALCRSGHGTAGATKVEHAAALVKKHLENPEAIEVAQSLQFAAEAYVKYREADWAAAGTCLKAALRCCQQLHDRWDYPVEGRRIHLVCNLARNEARAGNDQLAANLAVSMLNRLDAGEGFWPFPELDLRTPDDSLVQTDRWLLADQALSVAGIAAEHSSPISLRILATEFPLVASTAGTIYRARIWLDGIVAIADGDTDRFLLRCAEFFADGPDLLSGAWTEMTKKFAEHLLSAASVSICATGQSGN